MTRFWNLIFYNLFRFERSTQSFFNYPVLLVLRNEKVEERYRKRGVANPKGAVLKALNDPTTGPSSILSGGHMYVIFFLLIYGSINFISGFLRQEFYLEIEHFMLMFFVALVCGYFMLFRNDKYLGYFKKFERMSVVEKQKSAWLSFLVVVGIWLFCIGSFMYRSYRL
jgi:hypothetical protein